MSVSTIVSRNILNALAFKTNRKILIIESDDWGSIRMPSKQAYKKLLEKDLIDEKDPFLKYDSLESEQDLIGLFEVLSSVKDKNGNHAQVTANCIMANPDFDKIQQSGYQDYYFEKANDTFNKYPNHSRGIDLWLEGRDKKVFIPQLHGREHVNIGLWMNELKNPMSKYRKSFELGTFAINSQIVEALARNTHAINDLDPSNTVQEASVMFKDLFGNESISFIAPNYTWDFGIEESLKKVGIDFLQGSKKQNLKKENGEKKSIYHYTGQKNKKNQTFLVRNCLFEPSVSSKIDYLDICLNQIENAFYWKTPAIITSHRLNYLGELVEKNRSNNLKLLKRLLDAVIKKWPDIEFMSTDDLCQLIRKSKTDG